jgi:2-hydroxy-3-keto-5-methylthiopentenyl-1-phosphate phosphatase
MDSILSYMYCMIEKTRETGIPLTRESLVACGKDVEYHPGVEDWFERINRYAEEAGVEVEHYVLSSGLKEIIEGTSIAKYFKKIYACEFMYRDGQAVWPKLAVNYTNKTQFVYRINKGVLDISNNVELNSSRPDNEKRVFFSNMIYIGDGLTDVPCMKLVKQSGGHSIAIYHPGENGGAAKLLEHGRVDWMFEADYSEGSALDRTMKTLLQNLSYYNQLKGLNEQQKKDFR